MRRVLRKTALGSILFAGALLAAVAVEAQQPKKVARIGYLGGASLSAIQARVDAFQQGLRELGYVEGKNITVEWRADEGNRDRQRAIAAELVHRKVEVIVAVGAGDIRAAKEATATIPIGRTIFSQPSLGKSV